MSIIFDKIRLAKKNFLFKNIIFSIFSHGLNYLFPLITLPYLVRKLGVSSFGSLAFIQYVTNYFITLIIFGFHLTGTNEIAQSKSNFEKKNQIFHEIFFSRVFLFCGGLVILLILIGCIDTFSQTPVLYILAFLATLGWVFQSEFFYQGIQQMKILATANLISRLLALIIIFIGVNSPEDTSIAILGYGISGFISGFFCFFTAYKNHHLEWYIPKWKSIVDKLQSSYQVFISAMAVNLYSSSINLLILGFLTNTLLVGYYSIADRIFTIVCALSIPINQALFPYLSTLLVSDFKKYKIYTKKLVFIFILCLSFLALLLYFLAPYLINLISGRVEIQAVEILRILCFCMPFYPLGFTYTNIFIIHHQKKYITILNGSLVLINLSLIYPMLHFFGVQGLAYNNFIVFVAMSLIGGYIIVSKKIIQPISIDDK